MIPTISAIRNTQFCVTYHISMEYNLVIKKNEIMPFAATWMELEILRLSHRKTNTTLYDLYLDSKKKRIQMNLFTKQKQTHRHRKQADGYQRGKEPGRQIRSLRLADTNCYI